MFLKSKNKREEILRKLQMSKEKDRRSSQERRKEVEANVDKFINTMNNFRNSRLSFKDSQLQHKTLDNFQFKQAQKITVSPSKPQLYNTPSVKDIFFSKNQESQSLAKEFYELQESQNSEIKQLSPQKDNQIDFYKNKQEEEININNIQEEHSSHRNSEQAIDPIQDEEIKVPPLNFINNNSMNSSDNNNSDAIFFTSRFQQFLNNKEDSPNKEELSQIAQKSPKKEDHLQSAEKPPQVQPFKQKQKSPVRQDKQQDKNKEEYIKLQRNLKNNASGQSLAFSNDSSLKLSLNESAIHDVISKKLSNELVIQSISSSPQQKFKQICLKLQFKSYLNDFISFSKEVLLQNFITKNIKANFIDRLMVNKQLHFQLKKNEYKVNDHLATAMQNRRRKIFEVWRAISQNKIQNVLSFIDKRQNQIKGKCFRTFKMILFDRRINHQVDNYYLSKIFYAFKSVVDKQKKKMSQKVFKCYSRNLKRSMFHSLIEGCNNSKRQRQVVEMAENHYYYSQLAKAFTGWKEVTPKQQKFIRLAMTTKNILKQTKDNRLFQTKTFDFYQIK